jgi:hypothetical protein
VILLTFSLCSREGFVLAKCSFVVAAVLTSPDFTQVVLLAAASRSECEKLAISTTT